MKTLLKQKNNIKQQSTKISCNVIDMLKKTTGIWKNKKTEPILEWKKLRKSWDRKLPKLKISKSK